MARPDIELDPIAEEPPMLAFVRDYWWRQRGDRAMPRREDISPADMKAHLPHIILADVIDKGADFRYRLVGGQSQRFFAGNPTGRLMSEALAAFGSDTVEATLAAYRATVERRAPLRVRSTGAYFAQGAKLCDALLTPLSDDGVAVNMIFGAFTFIWNNDVQQAISRGADMGEADLARALKQGH
jgi:hypothetical protein